MSQWDYASETLDRLEFCIRGYRPRDTGQWLAQRPPSRWLPGKEWATTSFIQALPGDAAPWESCKTDEFSPLDGDWQQRAHIARPDVVMEPLRDTR